MTTPNNPTNQANYQFVNLREATFTGTFIKVFPRQLKRIVPASNEQSIYHSVFWTALTVAVSLWLCLFGSDKMKPNVEFGAWIAFWVALIIMVLSGIIIKIRKNPVQGIIDEILEQNEIVTNDERIADTGVAGDNGFH